MAGDIRQAIDIASLSKYLEERVPDIKLPIGVKQFGFGQSNPTYQLTASDGLKFVLRKKPPGKLLSKTAHQVEREYRIIHALEPTPVPVPKTFKLCDDASVVGTPFYIMEFLDGRIFEDPAFPRVPPQDRRVMWLEAVRALAKLHSIDLASVGLSGFGRPGSFYDRQIKTLSKVSMAQAHTVDVESKAEVGQIPHFDEIMAFFSNPKLQPKDRATLIHGDYKIDNVVFHKIEPKVIGILDWEMSTIGHPLSDLSNLFNPYVFGAFPSSAAALGLSNPSFTPARLLDGLPSREECMAAFAARAGWDPRPDSRWGDAFGVLRNSVIVQGIAARVALRQASSAKAQEHAVRLRPFGEFAWMLVKEAMGSSGAAEPKL